MAPFHPAQSINSQMKAHIDKSISEQKLSKRKQTKTPTNKMIPSAVKMNDGRKKGPAKPVDTNLVKLIILMLALVASSLYILSPKIVEPKEPSSVNNSSASPQVGDELEEEEGQYFNFLATVEQHFPQISLHEVPCHPKGYKKEAEIGIVPQRCGTMITDDLLNKTDIMKLRRMAMRVIDAIGDTNFHNRESINLKWINMHNLFRKGPKAKVFSNADFQLIKNASEAARTAISLAFGLPEEYVLFHAVSQFTRYKPVVPFSEFRHIDKLRSPNLIVTSILWLSTVDEDFGGGRTEFLTGPGPEPFSPLLVEPKIGRFAAWTSSYENPHAVREVIYGQRYALIFAFTVLQEFGYPDMDTFREWATTTDVLE